MKLTKENVYVDLRGKSKEELNLITEITGVENLKNYYYLHFYTPLNKWIRYHVWTDNIENKTEVTIEQLKEILKPMENKEEQLIKEAKERGFLTEGNEFYSCFSDKNKLRIIKPYNSKLEINLYLDKGGCLRYYDGLNNEYDVSLCSNPAIYKDGVWAEIKNNNLTLTEQLEKAKEEVQRLEKEIEEENEIKVGDWVKRNYLGIEIFKANNTHDYRYINSEKSLYQKITDSVLIESLNKLFKY